jgi:hypothetical protein
MLRTILESARKGRPPLSGRPSNSTTVKTRPTCNGKAEVPVERSMPLKITDFPLVAAPIKVYASDHPADLNQRMTRACQKINLPTRSIGIQSDIGCPLGSSAQKISTLCVLRASRYKTPHFPDFFLFSFLFLQLVNRGSLGSSCLPDSPFSLLPLDLPSLLWTFVPYTTGPSFSAPRLRTFLLPTAAGLY